VVQELMRHASSRVTLEVYSQARNAAKRQAQERVVQMILPERPDDAVPAISYGDPHPDVTYVDDIALWQAQRSDVNNLRS
jgi:Rod binding domain-containing protein